jgi:hypothetical protein
VDNWENKKDVIYSSAEEGVIYFMGCIYLLALIAMVIQLVLAIIFVDSTVLFPKRLLFGFLVLEDLGIYHTSTN